MALLCDYIILAVFMIHYVEYMLHTINGSWLRAHYMPDIVISILHMALILF